VRAAEGFLPSRICVAPANTIIANDSGESALRHPAREGRRQQGCRSPWPARGGHQRPVDAAKPMVRAHAGGSR
jgi:hypothetical protein